MECVTLGKMAGPTGFEPATSRLTIWRPNQAERRPRTSTYGGRSERQAYHMVVDQVLNFRNNILLTNISPVSAYQVLHNPMVGGTGIEPVTSAL